DAARPQRRGGGTDGSPLGLVMAQSRKDIAVDDELALRQGGRERGHRSPPMKSSNSALNSSGDSMFAACPQGSITAARTFGFASASALACSTGQYSLSRAATISTGTSQPAISGRQSATAWSCSSSSAVGGSLTPRTRSSGERSSALRIRRAVL